MSSSVLNEVDRAVSRASTTSRNKIHPVRSEDYTTELVDMSKIQANVDDKQEDKINETEVKIVAKELYNDDDEEDEDDEDSGNFLIRGRTFLFTSLKNVFPIFEFIFL